MMRDWKTENLQKFEKLKGKETSQKLKSSEGEKGKAKWENSFNV